MADCLRIEIELAFWSRIGGLSLDLIKEFEFADWGRIGLEYANICDGIFAMDWQNGQESMDC